jgi:DNA-binding MarR family transcriptional regulator
VKAATKRSAQQVRVLLGILESVQRDTAQSQRHLAAELGIALGLANAYLKRCVRKGLIKMRSAPGRRYAYYLTPHGFAEKSRLTLDYLSYSLDFFRQAKSDCRAKLDAARRCGYTRVVLAGRSDIAEIAAICALESDVNIIAVVDAADGPARFVGVPVVASFALVQQPFDAVLVTDMTDGRKGYERAVAAVGADRVLTPELLRVSNSGRRSS